MGKLLAHLAETVKAALRRELVIYGLWSAGGLLVLFAAGYALDALYTFLMFRWGGVAASLAVAAGLLLSAVAAVLAGYLISRTPSEPIIDRLQDSLERSPTAKRLDRSKKLMAPTIGGVFAGAVAAMATLFMLRRAPPSRDNLPDATIGLARVFIASHKGSAMQDQKSSLVPSCSASLFRAHLNEKSPITKPK